MAATTVGATASPVTDVIMFQRLLSWTEISPTRALACSPLSIRSTTLTPQQRRLTPLTPAARQAFGILSNAMLRGPRSLLPRTEPGVAETMAGVGYILSALDFSSMSGLGTREGRASIPVSLIRIPAGFSL